MKLRTALMFLGILLISFVANAAPDITGIVKSLTVRSSENRLQFVDFTLKTSDGQFKTLGIENTETRFISLLTAAIGKTVAVTRTGDDSDYVVTDISVFADTK